MKNLAYSEGRMRYWTRKQAVNRVNRHMSKQTREYDPVVASRIPRELKEKLLTKHPNNGDISRLIKVLLEKYLQGKILGVSMTKSNNT